MFEPNYVVHPSETVKETFDESGISIYDAERITGIPDLIWENIIHGSAPITAEVATGLQTLTKVPARFWINLQKGYDENCDRLNNLR